MDRTGQADQPPARHTLWSELWPVMLSLVVGALLMGVKFLAYYLTKSTAIFSDAMENVVNVLASGFAMYAVLLSHRPADKEHPYGHGKIEFMSAGFEGGMILLAAMVIVVRAIEALVLGQGPMDLVLGIGVTFGSAVLCAIMGVLLRQRGMSTGSVTLQADGVHLITDAVTGIAVITGLLLVRWTGYVWADAVVAILVSVWITLQAARLLRRSAAGLMDEQDEADTGLIKKIIDGHIGPRGTPPWICSYHQLRHRHSGRYHWVDFHIQVPAWWNVEQGHEVAGAIEGEIERSLGEGDATAHVEPCLRVDCPCCQSKDIKQRTMEILS
jgi:cation diffusion facilitator family transporter